MLYNKSMIFFTVQLMLSYAANKHSSLSHRHFELYYRRSLPSKRAIPQFRINSSPSCPLPRRASTISLSHSGEMRWRPKQASNITTTTILELPEGNLMNPCKLMSGKEKHVLHQAEQRRYRIISVSPNDHRYSANALDRIQGASPKQRSIR